MDLRNLLKELSTLYDLKLPSRINRVDDAGFALVDILLAFTSPDGYKLIAKYVMSLTILYVVIKFCLTGLDLAITLVKDQTDLKQISGNALDAVKEFNYVVDRIGIH